MPTSTAALLDTQGFHGRGARRYADRWLEALERARTMRDTDLPPLAVRTDGPPPPRVWAERDPVAAARLATAREARHRVRRGAPGARGEPAHPRLPAPGALEAAGRRAAEMEDAVADELSRLGARSWQVEIIAPLLTEAILDPHAEEHELSRPPG